MTHKKYDIFYGLIACHRNLADQAGLDKTLKGKYFEYVFKTKTCLDFCYLLCVLYKIYIFAQPAVFIFHY